MTRRQDIDRFAALLDGDRTAGAAAAEDERALHSLATLLTEARPEVPPMRAEFRADLRAQVLDAARERTAEPALMTRLRERVERFKYSTGLATATGLASVSLAGGGVAGAAEYAQPGELLYPTKLAIEDVRLWADTADATRGRRALSYAAERVQEAQAAADRGDMAGAQTALESAADRTEEGRTAITGSGDDTAILDMVDALTAQAQALQALAPSLTGSAAEAASAVSRQVQAGLDDAGGVISAPPTTTPPTTSTPAAPPTTDGAAPANPSGGGSTIVPPQDAPDSPQDVVPPGDAAQPEVPTDSDAPALPAPTVPPVDVPPVDLPDQLTPPDPSADDTDVPDTTTSSAAPQLPDGSGIIDTVDSVTGGVGVEGQ